MSNNSENNNKSVNKITILIIDGSEENKYKFWKEVSKRLEVTDYYTYQTSIKLDDILSLVEVEETMNIEDKSLSIRKKVKCIIFSGIKEFTSKEIGDELDNMVLYFSVDNTYETISYLELLEKL